MHKQNKVVKNFKDRKNERGAALVTVLMISSLMMVATIALLLESSMNTANVTDATAEEQAYYAAESGIQSAISAFRHNPRPNPLIDASKSPYPPAADADEANQIDYLKAVRRETSNQCTRSGTAPSFTYTCADPLDQVGNDLRLSRWLNYNWGPNGGTSATSKDRIVLGDPATYSPMNGFAYSVTVSDPDNTAGTVGYSMSGGVDPGTGYVSSYTTPGGATITYTPPAAQTVDVASGIGAGSLGSFTVTGNVAPIPAPSATPNAMTQLGGPIRFKIMMNVSQPQNTTVVVRGYIIPPGASLQSSASQPPCPRPGAALLFDSPGSVAFGSRIMLDFPNSTPGGSGCVVEEIPNTTPSGPYGTYLTGFLVQTTGGAQNIPVTITQPEPTRLMIKTVGYGPRGARKELEAVIQKNYFNGLGAPSPPTLIGPPCTQPVPIGNCVGTATPIPAAPVTSFQFDPGNSNPIFYSGKDKQLRVFLPPIGVTNDPNATTVKDVVRSFNGKVFGNVENIGSELPYWLQNPRNLDDTVQLLKAAAQSSGTYFGPTSSPPTSGAYGDWDSATGITFVDRDVEISGDGGGILVVTGRLNFKGNYRFNGLVLITGPPSGSNNGGFLRNGGGNGVLAGNMIVAPYNSWSLNSCMPNPLVVNKLNCYLAPRYEITGGGTSDLMYNSQNVTNGLSGLGNFVKGVAEK